MTGPDPVVPGVRRIAVLRANGIGDFLMIVPALEALRRAYPQAEITVLGDSWLPPFLVERCGPWDAAVTVPRYPGLRGVSPDAVTTDGVAGFLAEHRGRYDLALQVHGGGRTSNLFLQRLEARVTAGARTPDAAHLDRWTPYVAGRHEVLRWLEVAALVGGPAPPGLEGLVPRVTLTDRDRAEAADVLPDGGHLIGMHTGARDERRRWPVDRFVELARRLVADDPESRVVLVGSTPDRRSAATVAAALGDRALDVTGRLTLSGTLGVLARCELFVGNDSGPRHLAVAAGTPTVGVFWVGNALSFGPLVGPTHRSVVAFEVRCPVCQRPQLGERCDHDVSFVEEVSVAAVYEAALAARLRP